MGQNEEDRTATAREASHKSVRSEHERLVSELSQLADVRLELAEEGTEPPAGWTSVPVLAGEDPSGWQVLAEGQEPRHRLAAQLAAELVGARLSRAGGAGPLPRERRLQFLYETSRHVSGLVDEQKICDFVVREAAHLLQCGRASIMLLDPQTDSLVIRSSVGVPEHIAEQTMVRPGERISGKVFATGQQFVVRQGDPMPSESLGVRELSDSPSFLSVPLTMPDIDGTGQHQIVGVINLTRKAGGGAFSASDIRLVQTVAAHAAAQISSCRLFSAERERRRLAHELEIAADIQLRLLPEKPLAAGPVRVAGICRPAERIGGDFFDYWCDGDRVCLLVADVTGHDLAAALLATSLRSVVRSESSHRVSVAETVSRVNRTLYADLVRAEMQITLCYFELDLAQSLLTYCCCGHPYPLVLRGTRGQWLRAGGMLLGVTGDSQFEEQSMRIEPGDTLIAYTDGVLDAGLPERKSFGREGLLSAAREAAGNNDVEGLAQRLVRAVEEHIGDSPQKDDVTVLVARAAGSQSGP